MRGVKGTIQIFGLECKNLRMDFAFLLFCLLLRLLPYRQLNFSAVFTYPLCRIGFFQGNSLEQRVIPVRNSEGFKSNSQELRGEFVEALFSNFVNPPIFS